MTDPWCVLRMAPAATLALARSLSAAGFDVWTPTEVVTKRVPRANVKRKVTVALLPSFLFARAGHIPALLAIRADPVKHHREFRLFRQADRFPLIDDDALAPLRLIERRMKPRDGGLVGGERVKLTEGGFAGLSGVVESSRGDFATVAIPGFQNMKLRIARWHLQADDASDTRQAA